MAENIFLISVFLVIFIISIKSGIAADFSFLQDKENIILLFALSGLIIVCIFLAILIALKRSRSNSLPNYEAKTFDKETPLFKKNYSLIEEVRNMRISGINFSDVIKNLIAKGNSREETRLAVGQVYINEGKRKGYKPEQIEVILKERGWTEDEIAMLVF